MNEVCIERFVVVVERSEEADDVFAQGECDSAGFERAVGVDEFLCFRCDSRSDEFGEFERNHVDSDSDEKSQRGLPVQMEENSFREEHVHARGEEGNRNCGHSLRVRADEAEQEEAEISGEAFCFPEGQIPRDCAGRERKIRHIGFGEASPPGERVAGQEKPAGETRDLRVPEAFGNGNGRHERCGRREHAREAGEKLIDGFAVEERGQHDEPVGQQRLVVIGFEVDGRMKEIVREEHFTDDFEPAGFGAFDRLDAEIPDQQKRGAKPQREPEQEFFLFAVQTRFFRSGSGFGLYGSLAGGTVELHARTSLIAVTTSS